MVFIGSAWLMLRTATTTNPLPPVFPLPDFHYFDLRVYREAALLVDHGGPLYSAHLRHGLGFTYPPFAVLLFMPLSWLSLHAAELDSALINIVLTATAVHAAMRLGRPAAPARLRGGGSTVGWLAAAAALWIEPISTTIGYGQVDLLITVLVLVDLAYLRRTRVSGIGIGVAAALKLTPLIFIPYLLFTRRGPAAARALGVLAASIVVSFIALRRDAIAYWGGKFLDFSRVTGARHDAGAGPTNQSLRGAVMRLFPTVSDPRAIWLLAALVVAVVGLVIAVRVAQRGDQVMGFLLTAITGLLISPVSWTHHWTIAVPGVLALLVRSRRSVSGALGAVLALAFAVDGYVIWWLMLERPVPLHLGPAQLFVRDLYVVGGIGVIAFAGAGELRRLVGRRLEIPTLDGIFNVTSALGRSQRPPRPVPEAHPLTQAHAVTQSHPFHQPISVTQPPPQLAATGTGHPGATLRAITTSQPGPADRQSLR